MNNKKRGGARPGAGRHLKYNEPLVRTTIRVPETFARKIMDKHGTLQGWIDSLIAKQRNLQ